MTYLNEMTTLELRIHIGNACYQLWLNLPEPKLDYRTWYYDARHQSLSETLEGYRHDARNLSDDE